MPVLIPGRTATTVVRVVAHKLPIPAQGMHGVSLRGAFHASEQWGTCRQVSAVKHHTWVSAGDRDEHVCFSKVRVAAPCWESVVDRTRNRTRDVSHLSSVLL